MCENNALDLTNDQTFSFYLSHFQSTCVLSALNLTDENAIISVRLQNYSNATPLEAFDALKVISRDFRN